MATDTVTRIEFSKGNIYIYTTGGLNHREITAKPYDRQLTTVLFKLRQFLDGKTTNVTLEMLEDTLSIDEEDVFTITRPRLGVCVCKCPIKYKPVLEEYYEFVCITLFHSQIYADKCNKIYVFESSFKNKVTGIIQNDPDANPSNIFQKIKSKK